VSRGIRRLSFRGQALSAVTAVTLAILWPHAAPPVVDAATPQTGFVETTVMTGLIHPTVLRFAQDGRVFVAEKSGLIKVFDNLADPTPTVFADLRTNVHDFWDRGLLGMALHPDFPDTPFVYAAYTFDHELGSTNAPPRWGDTCPTPPGATTDGCVVSGRLSRLRAAGDAMTGAEQVLIEDWCQQYPSHSVGSVEFGPDGALYMSAGEAASFTFADHGQDGNPLNPCGDPPGGVGAVLAPPTAEGGALRAQDLRTSGDPVTLDGTIIRVDAATGAGLPTNPLASSADPNARRIIAHGLRNPFRFAFRPGSREIWIGDVGWNDWEEINRIVDPVDAQLENFGWPCYEHLQRQAAFDSANLTVCENLYAQPNADTKAYFAYHRDNNVVPGDGCPTGSGSISGLSFEFAPLGGSFPIEYRGALFFSDYSRDCLWVMPKDGGVLPAPGRVRPFVVGAANPVDLEFGPGGDLYYVDFDGGSIRRVAYAGVAPGSASFASPTSYPTATNAHGVGTGDVNGDGKLDLAVANAGSGNVSVLLGNGNGTFQASANFATGVSPKSVTVADVSGDGRLDLVTADQGSSTVSVLRGNGAGSFAAATSFPACNQAHEVALGNFNGDGMPDIAVACWGGSVISVLLATGGGSFGPPINSTSGAAPHSLVARDFDRDGKQDLAVANRDGNNVGVLRGNGNGTFAAPAVYPTGAGPHSIRIGDLNRDGNSDLVTANEAADNVSVLLGAAGGTFAPASNYATGQVPKGIAVGDLNGDGLPDVVTSNTAGNYPSGNSNPGGDQVSVLLGNGAGALGSPANFLAGHTPFSVVVAQLDSDGQPDLATANWFGNSVSVIRNTTAGAAPPPTGSTYLSDLAWTSMTNGWGPVELDRSNGEQATGDGRTITLNGTTYTKGLGAHALSDVRYALSGSCSRFTAQVGVDDEVGANGSVTFEVYTGTTRVYDSGPMTGVTAARAVDVSIAGATALRLVVTDGGDGNGFDHADWAVAQIECSSGQDTTPPNVTATTPAAGATGVAVTVSPTATFSEAMDPASLTSTTFSLVAQGQSTPIPAAVSYANRVATLDPNGDLAAATSYTATVKGGVGGARDLAGNVLSADVSWTFTTAGAAPPANRPPSATIDGPAATLKWKVADVVSFAGHATDPEDGTIPASRLSWSLVLQHCPSSCHSHPVETWSGISAGSFSTPDHEYPSYLELTLTAADSAGLTGTVTRRLDPRTVDLTFGASPGGLQLVVNATSSNAPFMRTVIVGSTNSVSATSPQVQGGSTYEFSAWSDGGAQTHNVIAPESPSTFTASYVVAPPRNTGLPAISGPARVGRTVTVSDGTWSGSQPMTFGYQWLRCSSTDALSCTPIPDSATKNYTITSNDVDFRLRATVTATNAGGTATATSNASQRVKG
jgi:glucose/arabinose dehydrogenase